VGRDWGKKKVERLETENMEKENMESGGGGESWREGELERRVEKGRGDGERKVEKETRSAQRRTVDSFWGKTIRYDTDTIRYDTTDDTRRHITKNNTTRDIRITLRLSRHYDITGTT
jgi:hypothetical protein